MGNVYGQFIVVELRHQLLQFLTQELRPIRHLKQENREIFPFISSKKYQDHQIPVSHRSRTKLDWNRRQPKNECQIPLKQCDRRNRLYYLYANCYLHLCFITFRIRSNCCGNNSKDEDNCPHVNNINNDNSSSEKFRQNPSLPLD